MRGEELVIVQASQMVLWRGTGRHKRLYTHLITPLVHRIDVRLRHRIDTTPSQPGIGDAVTDKVVFLGKQIGVTIRHVVTPVPTTG